MHVSDGNPATDKEAQLRAEIEDLKRKLEDHQRAAKPAHAHGVKRVSPAALWIMAIVVVLIVLGAFFAGYLPQTNRQTALAKEARDESAELLPVNVSLVEQAPANSQLTLPGSIQ